MALAALRPYGLRSMIVTSMQAISGAGYPGVASLDILGNVLPNVANGSEAKKLETEPRKILGGVTPAGESEPLADFVISAHTNRVPVVALPLLTDLCLRGFPLCVRCVPHLFARSNTMRLRRLEWRHGSELKYLNEMRRSSLKRHHIGTGCCGYQNCASAIKSAAAAAAVWPLPLGSLACLCTLSVGFCRNLPFDLSLLAHAAPRLTELRLHGLSPQFWSSGPRRR